MRLDSRMMDLRETLSVAIDALRGNKMRAIHPIGCDIGSASIVWSSPSPLRPQIRARPD